MFLWATDLHLNYFSNDYINNFGKSLKKYNAKALIVSGDISLGNRFKNDIQVLSESIGIPIYYVLGNHDYWYSSISEINLISKELQSNNIYNLNYNIVEINNSTALLGFDGWYDCNYLIDPEYKMSDWHKIKDFKDKDPIQYSIELSKSFYYFKDVSLKAKEIGYVNQLIVTHVPPYKELIIEKPFSFYCSSFSGEMLNSLELNKIVCLSGHTHNRSSYIKNNIKTYVGEACRGKPSVCGLIDEDLNVNLIYHNQ